MLEPAELYKGYTAYDFLEAGKDYRSFEYAEQIGRVPAYTGLDLTTAETERTRNLLAQETVISLHDHVRAMEHAVFADALRGPANLVAPNPVTNATFAATLGRVLNRPALLPLPGVALELMFGEMARATILAGQRVAPHALAASGFEFADPTLEGALRGMLNSQS